MGTGSKQHSRQRQHMCKGFTQWASHDESRAFRHSYHDRHFTNQGCLLQGLAVPLCLSSVAWFFLASTLLPGGSIEIAVVAEAAGH